MLLVEDALKFFLISRAIIHSHGTTLFEIHGEKHCDDTAELR